MKSRYVKSKCRSELLKRRLKRNNRMSFICWGEKEGVVRELNNSLTHDEKVRIEREVNDYLDGFICLYGEKYIFNENMYCNFDPVHTNGKEGQESDVRVIWEISRLNILLKIAIVANLTGHRKYIEKYKEVICDWIKQNATNESVNWSNAMEASIRIINIIESYKIIRNSLDDSQFEEKINSIICEHREFILNNLENNLFVNNHYLFDLIGLIWISQLENSKESRMIRKFSEMELYTFLKDQFDNDCVNIEKSTTYHAFMIEALFYMKFLYEVNDIKIKDSLSSIVIKGSECVESITKKKEILIIGDNDSGRLLMWDDMSYHGYACFSNLNSQKIKEYFVGDFKKSITDFKFVERFFLKPFVRHYPEFGLLVIRRNEMLFTIRTNNNIYGYGGHAHNDQLAVTLSKGSKDLIHDSGCCSYNLCIKERHRIRKEQYHSTIYFSEYMQNKLLNMEKFKIKKNSDSSIKKISDTEYSVEIIYENKMTLTRKVEISVDQIVITDCGEESFCYSLIYDNLGKEFFWDYKGINACNYKTVTIYENYAKGISVQYLNLQGINQIKTYIEIGKEYEN